MFLHGTVIMHAGAIGHSRAEIVAQSRSGSGHGLKEFESYVPIGDCVAKLSMWARDGAAISYLSSHREPSDVDRDATVLRRHAFPPGPILSRRPGENYGKPVEREMPDALIEDDCESIGTEEVAYFQMSPEARRQVTSIIVPEFGGIDHLPDDLSALLTLASAVSERPQRRVDDR